MYYCIIITITVLWALIMGPWAIATFLELVVGFHLGSQGELSENQKATVQLKEWQRSSEYKAEAKKQELEQRSIYAKNQNESKKLPLKLSFFALVIGGVYLSTNPISEDIIIYAFLFFIAVVVFLIHSGIYYYNQVISEKRENLFTKTMDFLMRIIILLFGLGFLYLLYVWFV